VHPFLFKEVIDRGPYLVECVRKAFWLRTSPQPIQTYLSQMEIEQIDKAVLLPIDATTSFNCSMPTNDIVAEIVERYPDKFIGFGSIDPNNVESGVKELERIVNELNLSGLKLVPYIQNFDPSDKKFYPIYEKAQELGIPILLHTGMTYVPHGKLDYCHPLKIDEIALNFPDLKIILAHFGWPWVVDAAILAMRHKNVYLDISDCFSGTPYEHLKTLLIEQIPQRIVERFISDKILFGSNYPRIEADKMLRALKALPLREDVKQKIMSKNARNLLKI